MAFILAKQREVDCRAAFARYEAYLAEQKARFPKKAYALATSNWYFSFDDQRAPHDARLRSVTLTDAEPAEKDGLLQSSIRVSLFGAQSDVVIEFTYSGVIAYSLSASMVLQGHCDWRYDEFRLSATGNLIHQIEWWGASQTANWTIEASDVEHTWRRIAHRKQ